MAAPLEGAAMKLHILSDLHLEFTAFDYVPGNHEYYGHDLALLDDLRRRTRRTKIHVLDHETASIEGVRFVGASLWTDFDLFGLDRRPGAFDVAREELVDFRMIRDHGRSFTPERSREIHRRSRLWIHGHTHTSFDYEARGTRVVCNPRG
jgi:hypothetical protein